MKVYDQKQPGPGDYKSKVDSSKHKNPVYGFGSNKRRISRKLREATSLPGPGSYHIPCTIGEVPEYERGV